MLTLFFRTAYINDWKNYILKWTNAQMNKLQRISARPNNHKIGGQLHLQKFFTDLFSYFFLLGTTWKRTKTFVVDLSTHFSRSYMCKYKNTWECLKMNCTKYSNLCIYVIVLLYYYITHSLWVIFRTHQSSDSEHSWEHHWRSQRTTHNCFILKNWSRLQI